MGLLVAIVLVHFLITLAHGAAHSGAQVGLGPAGMAFVIAVIEAGPLVGLVLAFIRPVAGAALVAATMAGAFLFGVINHFIIVSADHVSQVAPPWHTPFTATAVLLAVVELAAAWVAVRCMTRVLRISPISSI